MLLKIIIVRAGNLSSRQFNLLVFDPQKKEYRSLIRKLHSLKIITPNQLKINPLLVHPFHDIQRHVILVAEILVSEAYLGGTSRNVIIHLLFSLYKKYDQPTMLSLLLEIKKLKKYKSNTYRMNDLYLLLENRIEAFIESGIFSCQHGIPLEMYQKYDLVFELDGLQDMVKNFIVAFIVRSLYLANVARGKTDARLRHLIIIDEARTLLQANRDLSTFGESAINEDSSRVRATGIGGVYCTQEPRSVSPTIRSLAFTKIAFPLNDGADLDFVQEGWGLDKDQRDYIFKLPAHGQAVVRYGGYPKPFILAVPALEDELPVPDEELAQAMGPFWADLEQLVNAETPSADTSVHDSIPALAAGLLHHFGVNPFRSLMEIYDLPDFNQKTVNKAIDWLVNNGYLRQEGYKTGGRKPAQYFVLLQKALDYLGISSIPGKGGFEHKLYQHLVWQWLKDQGITANLEGRTRKNSQNLIDVLAGTAKQGYVAYEITLTMDNMAENILNDLASGVSEVVVVTKAGETKKARSLAVKDPMLAMRLENVSFKSICDFSRPSG